MNNNRTGVLAVGALLVALGVLFLLQNFGFFGSVRTRSGWCSLAWRD